MQWLSGFSGDGGSDGNSWWWCKICWWPMYLYSSLSPYARMRSWNSFITSSAHLFINFNALTSFGFSNSWLSENLTHTCNDWLLFHTNTPSNLLFLHIHPWLLTWLNRVRLSTLWLPPWVPEVLGLGCGEWLTEPKWQWYIFPWEFLTQHSFRKHFWEIKESTYENFFHLTAQQ